MATALAHNYRKSQPKMAPHTLAAQSSRSRTACTCKRRFAEALHLGDPFHLPGRSPGLVTRGLMDAFLPSQVMDIETSPETKPAAPSLVTAHINHLAGNSINIPVDVGDEAEDDPLMSCLSSSAPGADGGSRHSRSVAAHASLEFKLMLWVGTSSMSGCAAELCSVLSLFVLG